MSSMAAVQDVAETAQLRLEMTRLIKAPRAQVFDAWTRPEAIRVWFGSETMQPTEVTTEPKVGGAYSIGMESGGEPVRKSRAWGTYTKVDPYDLLQFTWVNDWIPNEETLVTVHFRDVDGGTEVRLIHDRFKTEMSRDAHNQGWVGGMDRLQAKIDEALAA